MEVVATSAFLAVCATVAVLPTPAGVKASAIALGRPVCDKAIKAGSLLERIWLDLFLFLFPQKFLQGLIHLAVFMKPAVLAALASDL